MEIVIKTHDEFWRDRVTIEISGTAEEATVVSSKLTAGPGYWATAAEQAERRVRELEDRVAGLVRANEEAEKDKDTLYLKLVAAQDAREIETRERLAAEHKVRLYDQDRRTERDRADRAQEREKGLGVRVAELEQELARYRRAHVCTARCTKDAHVAFEGRTLVEELEAERDGLKAQVSELTYNLRLATEEQARRFTTAQVEDAKAGARADERARLERENGTSAVRAKLDEVSRAVLGMELREEIKSYREASAAMLMVEALTEVRRLTGATPV